MMPASLSFFSDRGLRLNYLWAFWNSGICYMRFYSCRCYIHHINIQFHSFKFLSKTIQYARSKNNYICKQQHSWYLHIMMCYMETEHIFIPPMFLGCLVSSYLDKFRLLFFKYCNFEWYGSFLWNLWQKLSLSPSYLFFLIPSSHSSSSPSYPLLLLLLTSHPLTYFSSFS